MKAILSGQRRMMFCALLCLIGCLDAMRASNVPSAADSSGSGTLVVPPPGPPPEFWKGDIERETSPEATELTRLEEEERLRFFEAIALGEVDAVREKLNEGLDPNAEISIPVPDAFQNRFSDKRLRYYLSREEGFTALMLATALGDHTLVKILLQAGADPWKTTRKHKTFALWLAAKSKNIDIMRSLMGIGPNHKSNAFRITVNLAKQNALLWRNGKVEMITSISSGRRSHPTPTGRYLVTNKYRVWQSTLYPAKMPFFLRLSCGDFGLHMGRVPGYPASHGCIRLPERSARRLYSLVPVGTLVEIH
jgi:ankyrin repeat protein